MSYTTPCNCLKESEEKMLNHLKEVLSKNKNISHFNEKEAGYTNVALMFDGPMSRRLFLIHELPYTPIKVNGEEGKERIEKTNVFFSFCPFCGTKYPEDKDDMKQIEE